MAGLADDWEENRQTCIAYLRMPYEPEPGDEAAAERLVSRASREVRHTVIRVIAAHLRKDAMESWQGRNFDFTGVVFDGGGFNGAEFSGGEGSASSVPSSLATSGCPAPGFSGGKVDFSRPANLSQQSVFDEWGPTPPQA